MYQLLSRATGHRTRRILAPNARDRSQTVPTPARVGLPPHNLLLDATSLAVPPRRTTYPLEVRLSPAHQPLQQAHSSVGSGRARSGRRAKASTPPSKPAPRTARPLYPHPHRLTCPAKRPFIFPIHHRYSGRTAVHDQKGLLTVPASIQPSSQDHLRLADKVAIVTGAGTRSENVAGVGVASAVLFAAHGAKVLIVDLDEAAAKKTQATIRDAGGEASIYIADVADETNCRELVEAAIERHGRLDILMNSVGVSGPGMVTEVTEEVWNRTLDVDLKSMILLCKYAVPAMINSGGGSIINVSSVDGIRAGMTRNIPYAAAKGGMIAATRAMAVHHGRDNVRVNCIAPGMLYTSMTEFVGEKTRDLRRRVAPLGTEGKAEDVALAALFLASGESRWITGVLLPVDAGLMAAGPQSVLANVLDNIDDIED